MSSIILDTSGYKARTGRVPPKKGAVSARFIVDGSPVNVEADSFAAAVNAAKRFAREAKVHTVTLESVKQ